ncbi:MAG: ABC transporter permease [Chloroflexi bacterium]|nr:ABC transporter permease [Chloroflexota bacterium]
MLLRIWNLVLKELVQFARDWLMTTFMLTLPVIQLVLMAQSTSSRVSDLCATVLDLDRSAASRQLVTALDTVQEVNVCHFSMTLADTHSLLDQGEVSLVVVIPNGFAADIVDASRTPNIQFITDASSSVPARYALSGAQGAVTAFMADLFREAGLLSSAQVLDSVIDFRTTVRFNPELDFRFVSVSAQLGFIVYQVTLVVASIGLARERELGTLEQLLVVPLRRVELVIGKAIPALIIGMINFVIILAVSVFVFNLPVRGSLPLFFALTLLFIAVEIGYGIFISGVARTQQQAILFVFVLAIVDMTFSGYMVRVKNLPPALQAVAQIVPFRHYLTIVRGVMLKGAGLDVLWPHAVAMALMGILVTVVAVRNLSRSLD